MRQRRANPNNGNWKEYGGRGIRICERWESFENFLADMGPCPANYTIERKNNSGDYEPGNCVWASRKVQSRNKRNVPLFTFNGKILSIAEWSELTGIHPETLRNRIRRGWTVEETITTPTRPLVRRNTEPSAAGPLPD